MNEHSITWKYEQKHNSPDSQMEKKKTSDRVLYNSDHDTMNQDKKDKDEGK